MAQAHRNAIVQLKEEHRNTLCKLGETIDEFEMYVRLYIVNKYSKQIKLLFHSSLNSVVGNQLHLLTTEELPHLDIFITSNTL